MLLLGALLPAKSCLFVGSMNRARTCGQVCPNMSTGAPGGAGEAEGKRERGWDRAAPPCICVWHNWCGHIAVGVGGFQI